MAGWMRVVAVVLGRGLGTGCTSGKGEPGCCDGCCVQDSTEFPGYLYDEKYVGGDNLDNWAHRSLREITIEPDLPSFAGVMKQPVTNVPYELANVREALETFAKYWNDSGAEITVTVGSTGINCCNSLTDSDPGCQDCRADAQSSIYVWNGDSSEISTIGAAALTGPTFDGDCLVAKDIVVTTGYYQDDGSWCSYNWQYDYGDDDTSDCSDGEKTKLFKDSLVHEFGHFVGLAHQAFVDFPSSAMLDGESCCTDGECACSYDEVRNPDQGALVELYSQCL